MKEILFNFNVVMQYFFAAVVGTTIPEDLHTIYHS